MKTLGKIIKPLAALCLALCLIMSAVYLVTWQPWTYEAYLQHLANPLKLSVETMRGNYRELCRFCLAPTYEASYPQVKNLSMSAEGKQHFAEVRDIFQVFYYLWPIFIALYLLIILLDLPRREEVFKNAAVFSFLLPLALVLWIAVDFSSAFTLFHKLFFRNDYWIFDGTTDPVIYYLPQELFQSLSLLIIVIIAAFALICFSLSKHIKYKK